MARVSDVRRIALSLPNTVEEAGRLAFSVQRGKTAKAIAWSWLERVEPKKPRVENRNVLAVRISGEEEKQFLIDAAPKKFFTEPHYNGFPAILVRLDAIGTRELRSLLTAAWKLQAPRALVKEYEASTTSKKERS